MKTSSWRLYHGPGQVSISRFAPRAAPAGYAVCRRLIPGPWSRSGGRWVDHVTFVRGYAEQLAALDPQATFDAIVARVAPHEPVLLCWETPPWHYPHHWCHRTTVADWFKQTLGVEVLELDIPAAAAIKLDRGMVPFWAAGSAPEKL